MELDYDGYSREEIEKILTGTMTILERQSNTTDPDYFNSINLLVSIYILVRVD